MLWIDPNRRQWRERRGSARAKLNDFSYDIEKLAESGQPWINAELMAQASTSMESTSFKSCPRCALPVTLEVDQCPRCGCQPIPELRRPAPGMLAYRPAYNTLPQSFSGAAHSPVSYKPGPGQIARLPGAQSPGIAILLSFLLPGAGQLYNGQTAKGLAYLLGTFLLVCLTFGFALPIAVPLSMIDAGLVAGRLNRGETIGAWQWF